MIALCMWYHQDWQAACCAQIKRYMCDGLLRYLTYSYLFGCVEPEKKIVGQGAVLKTRRVKHSADFYRYR